MLNRRELLHTMIGVSGALALNSVTLRSAGAMRFMPAPGDFDKDPIQILKLTDTLSVLSGPGGNIAVLTGADGVVQVDSGVPSRASDIAQSIAGISAKPITMLINTHWHFDHTGGNAAVGKTGAHILAQTNTRKRLATEQTIEFFKMTIPPSPAEALPTLTFADNLTLYVNGEEIELTHVAPAHTDSDIFLHFRQANVVHAGDILFNGFYPFIDYSSKGWIGGMVKAADAILKIADAKTRIIPGHGAVATRDDVARYRDMLDTVQKRVEPMVKAGRGTEAAVAAKPTQDLDAKWGKGIMTSEQFVQMVYTGIERHLKTKQAASEKA